MGKIKVGDFVRDKDGTRGRVLRVDYIPANGRGSHPREDIYVEWLIGGLEQGEEV